MSPVGTLATPLSRRDLEELEAQCYAAAYMREGLRHDWPARNADIIARLSLTALGRIKRRAWQIVGAEL